MVDADEAGAGPPCSGTPFPRHAADDIAALALEPIDYVEAGIGVPGMTGIVETKSPDAHDWLAILFGIGGRGRMSFHLVGPIRFDFGLHRGPTANIVHDVEFPTVGFGGCSHFLGHPIASRSFGAVGIESLQGRGIDSILLHPKE